MQKPLDGAVSVRKGFEMNQFHKASSNFQNMLRLRFQGRVFFQKSVHIVRTDVDILFGIAVVDKPGSLGLLLRRIAADEEEVAGFNNIKADNPAGTGLRIILIGGQIVPGQPFSLFCQLPDQFHRQLFLALRRGRTTWKEAQNKTQNDQQQYRLYAVWHG